MKYFFWILFLFLSSTALASAAEISVLQENYLAGETVQVYVSASSLSTTDILLFDENNTLKEISPLFTEYRDGLYFVSFDLFEAYSQGVYTLQIQEAQDHFQIIPLQGQPVLQIKPSFILLDSLDDTFFFELSNIGDSSTTVLLFGSDNALIFRKSDISISPGEEKNSYADYIYSRISSDLYINVSYDEQYYILPVIYPDLIVEEEIAVEAENVTLEENVTVSMNETIPFSEDIPFVFLVTDHSVTLTIDETQSVYGDLKVQNVGNDTFSSLHYSLTGDLDLLLSLNETDISLASGEIYSQRIWFNRGNNSRVGTYEGYLVLEDDRHAQNLSIVVTVAPFVNRTENSAGNVFENQTSDAYTIVYNENTFPDESSGNAVYIIGGILIALLLGLIVLVALKLRQKDEKKFKEYIEETKKKR